MLGWDPWPLTAVVLVLPEPMAGEALQQPAAAAALAGVGGYRRWPVSLGKPNSALSLSLSMSSDENAIFLFCYVLLHAKCLTGCLILMLHFLHFYIADKPFPFSGDKMTFCFLT